MLYRVLYSRFMEDTSTPSLVEDDIEASRFDIKGAGCLVFFRRVKETDESGDSYEHDVPFFTVPTGAWIMVEPSTGKPAEQGRVVARNNPVGPTPSGIVIPR